MAPRLDTGTLRGDSSMKITVNGISVNYTLDGPSSGPVITMSNSLASNLSM
jgi:hypothetical protein